MNKSNSTPSPAENPSDHTPERSFGLRAEQQRQIDISNLRFYADMAKRYLWSTDVIDSSVITHTLSEIADRIAALETADSPRSHTPESSPDSRGVEQQHSPLPFAAIPQSNYATDRAESRWSIVDRNGMVIAVMVGRLVPHEQSNARYLVRAANALPDAVNALQEARRQIILLLAGGNYDIDSARVINVIDAALAITRGEG